MPRDIRMEVYKYGIKNLQEMGKVFYVNIDKAVALERLQARNETLKQGDTVRQDKAADKFVTEEFDKWSALYEKEMIPALAKMGLQSEIVDNSGTIAETVQQIIEKLSI
ncbi:MAG: hypothetical protein WCG98_04385 [bacterium]